MQEKRPARLAMTPDVLAILKRNLVKARLPLVEKRLIWAAACFLFVGSLRSGEILPAGKTHFVKDCTLRNQHVTIVKKMVEGEEIEMMEVFLQAPKEDKKRRGVTIELMRLPHAFFCPVKAWKSWREASKLDNNPKSPVFRKEDGRGFTQSELNKILKGMLEHEYDYSEGRISAHSFRAGITTTMGRLGYSTELIQLQGRWRSDAYLRYCKQGRATRLKDQWILMADMAKVSTTWLSGGVLVQ